MSRRKGVTHRNGELTIENDIVAIIIIEGEPLPVEREREFSLGVISDFDWNRHSHFRAC